MSGCTSCGTSKTSEGEVSGCKSNGTCGTSGCNKMNVFDWLSGMDIPMVDRYDIVEVRFKGGKKDYFRNSNRIELTTGDAIVVEMPSGVHLGHVSLMGELVRLQMQKKKLRDNDEILKVLRIAHQKDIEKAQEAKNREANTLYRSRELIQELKLNMKLSDIEYQSDLSKATFYYSAEDRVDFRELIKTLAGEFKIRVEMRQISLRQEAGRLGGIGSCGRELCCSTWLSDFKSVGTSAARYQNLSLNPSKLSGQCGRLKCCLNYELDTYMDALKDIPNVESSIKTAKGEARLQKTDIFRKIMWFGFAGDNNWYPVDTSRVAEIIELNKAGKTPDTLFEDKLHINLPEGNKIKDGLDELDKKYQGPAKKKKKKKKKRPAGISGQGQVGGQVPANTGNPKPNPPQNTAPANDGTAKPPANKSRRPKSKYRGPRRNNNSSNE